jgi:hypothetical protein
MTNDYETMRLTMYDIGAEDLHIYAEKRKYGQIAVMVTNDADDVLYNEESARAAWDAMVSFAHQIIRQNDKIEAQE